MNRAGNVVLRLDPRVYAFASFLGVIIAVVGSVHGRSVRAAVLDPADGTWDHILPFIAGSALAVAAGGGFLLRKRMQNRRR